MKSLLEENQEAKNAYKHIKDCYNSPNTTEALDKVELRELVRSEKINIVVVYSLGRFSRDSVHGVILMQELEKHGVNLDAATETVDNSEVVKRPTSSVETVTSLLP